MGGGRLRSRIRRLGIDGSWATLERIRRSGRMPAERDVAHLAAWYDQGIRYTDHWIGEVAAGLAARGLGSAELIRLLSCWLARTGKGASP